MVLQYDGKNFTGANFSKNVKMPFEENFAVSIFMPTQALGHILQLHGSKLCDGSKTTMPTEEFGLL